MSNAEPDGTIAFRFQTIERRLSRIEDLEPAVLKQQITAVKDEQHEISSELKALRDTFQKEAASVRALLTRFFIAMSIALVSGIIYVLISTRP